MLVFTDPRYTAVAPRLSAITWLSARTRWDAQRRPFLPCASMCRRRGLMPALATRRGSHVPLRRAACMVAATLAVVIHGGADTADVSLAATSDRR